MVSQLEKLRSDKVFIRRLKKLRAELGNKTLDTVLNKLQQPKPAGRPNLDGDVLREVYAGVQAILATQPQSNVNAASKTFAKSTGLHFKHVEKLYRWATTARDLLGDDDDKVDWHVVQYRVTQHRASKGRAA